MSEEILQTLAATSYPKPIAKLIWMEGDAEKEIVLGIAGLTIGRSPDNYLALEEDGVSRYHCKILPQDDGLIVVDLGSSNGTRVNGELITDSHPVTGKDTIQIGNIDFKIEIFDREEIPELSIPEETPPQVGVTRIVAAASDLPRLVISSGVGIGTEHPLIQDKMVIGRASRNKKWDIDLVDRAASRPHAEILHQGDQWLLNDLGSANGTKLNGERVEGSSMLTEGDAIAIGESVLIFRRKSGE